MAWFSFYRIFRFLSSSFANIITTLGFAGILTFIFILYQPSNGPGVSQKVGWESWENILAGDLAYANLPIEKPVSYSGAWWNTTHSDVEDSPSLPLDIWDPVLRHHTGLTEITVKRCVLYLSGTQLCRPKSTKEEETTLGKWVRVDRNINPFGIWTLTIYYRRTRRQDVPLIWDIALLRKGSEPDSKENWHQASLSVRDGVHNVPPLYLWYKLGKTAKESSIEEYAQNVITEIDITYGFNRPWHGFTKLYPPTMPASSVADEVSITIRRGLPKPQPAQPLHFNFDGKFKIMQVADLHFSVGGGDCRRASIGDCKDADNQTLSLLEKTLDLEKPDMLVFTGDQLNGQGSSYDAMSVLSKFTYIMEERKIAWAAVFGNHDDEDSDRRTEQIRWMQSLPYSLVQPGPRDIHGVGNYILKVKSPDPSATHILTLYFLDSGSYSSGVGWMDIFKPKEYDWIHEDQVNWFLAESSTIDPIERPFQPDGGSDLGHIWDRSQITPMTKKFAKPNALMFFHMPLQESYKAAPDQDPATRKPYDVGSHDLEQSGAAKTNGGMFENGLVKAKESTSGNVPEVKVVGNGHCHLTDNCRRIKGVWLCFGGGGSYAGYGRIGFDRRFRIFDISNYGETIRTYKRTEKGQIIDDMILAGAGAPPYTK